MISMKTNNIAITDGDIQDVLDDMLFAINRSIDKINAESKYEISAIKTIIFEKKTGDGFTVPLNTDSRQG